MGTQNPMKKQKYKTLAYSKTPVISMEPTQAKSHKMSNPTYFTLFNNF